MPVSLTGRHVLTGGRTRDARSGASAGHVRGSQTAAGCAGRAASPWSSARAVSAQILPPGRCTFCPRPIVAVRRDAFAKTALSPGNHSGRTQPAGHLTDQSQVTE